MIVGANDRTVYGVNTLCDPFSSRDTFCGVSGLEDFPGVRDSSLRNDNGAILANDSRKGDENVSISGLCIFNPCFGCRFFFASSRVLIILL